MTGSPIRIVPELRIRHAEPARLRRAAAAPGPMSSSSNRQGASIRTTSSSTSPIVSRVPARVGMSPASTVMLRRVAP